MYPPQSISQRQTALKESLYVWWRKLIIRSANGAELAPAGKHIKTTPQGTLKLFSIHHHSGSWYKSAMLIYIFLEEVQESTRTTSFLKCPFSANPTGRHLPYIFSPMAPFQQSCSASLFPHSTKDPIIHILSISLLFKRRKACFIAEVMV